jgi:hypothetical protein
VGRIAAVFCGAGGLFVLLGAQGARFGSIEIPGWSPWWVLGLTVLALLVLDRNVDAPSGRRLAIAAFALLVSLFALLFWRGRALHPDDAFEVVIDSERRAAATSLQIPRRNELRRLSGKRQNVVLETSGILEVPLSGAYVFDLFCDDSCEIALGSNRVLAARGSLTESIDLVEGDVPFSLRYRQGSGPAQLRFSWDGPAAVELLPIDHFVHPPGTDARARWSAHLALAAFVVWWLAFGWHLTSIVRARARWIGSRWAPAGGALLLVLYGAALRLEAFLAHSGLAERGGRAERVHEALLPFLPAYGVFNPENAPEDPYRADVRSYLDRAESMTPTTFYAPSFREPFYVLLARAFIGLAGGEIGILVESFFFSSITLALFWLAAFRLHGRWWAAGLLLPVSLHEWLVLDAPTGYRESAYAFFLLGFVMFLARSSVKKKAAAAGGLLAALVTLIRLSALSVVAPLLALRLGSLPREARLRYAAIFLGVLAVLVAPFLISNYRAHGDPFYSISFHTEFWLAAEGLDRGQGPVSFVRYFTDFGRAGDVVRGTLLGLTVLPLRTFWNGLRAFPVLGVLTLALGAAGLLMLRRNRYLAAAYVGHLIPFAYIQNFPSGEMPRFVMPAFFFLVLAIPGPAAAVSTLVRRRRYSPRRREP